MRSLPLLKVRSLRIVRREFSTAELPLKSSSRKAMLLVGKYPLTSRVYSSLRSFDTATGPKSSEGSVVGDRRYPKKVHPEKPLATALTSSDFPVPGRPNRNAFCLVMMLAKSPSMTTLRSKKDALSEARKF